VTLGVLSAGPVGGFVEATGSRAIVVVVRAVVDGVDVAEVSGAVGGAAVVAPEGRTSTEASTGHASAAIRSDDAIRGNRSFQLKGVRAF
jgi:hypothetical protein